MFPEESPMHYKLKKNFEGWMYSDLPSLILGQPIALSSFEYKMRNKKRYMLDNAIDRKINRVTAKN